MMITGSLAQKAEQTVARAKLDVINVTVSIDLLARTIVFEATGAKLTSKITGPIDAVTRYGCGGSNADNLFTAITVHE